MSRQAADELLAEANGHLQDGIAGRLELGMDAESAERDAVAAFGNVKTIARQIIERRLQRRDRARLAALSVNHLFLYAALLCFTVSASPLLSGFFLLATVGSLILFAGMAGFARRPASLKVMAVSLGASVACFAAISSVFIDVGRFSGSGLVYRWEARKLADDDARLIQERSEDHGRFQALGFTWESSGRATGRYPMPLTVGDARYGRIDYRYTRNHEEAAAAWTALTDRAPARFDTTALQQVVSGLNNALSNPLPDTVAFCLPAAPYIAVLAGFMGGIDLFCGGLGAAFFRLRRRRRGAA